MEVAFVALAAATTLGAAISGAAIAKRRRRDSQLGLPAIQDGGHGDVLPIRGREQFMLERAEQAEAQVAAAARPPTTLSSTSATRLPVTPDTFANDTRRNFEAGVQALKEDMRATEAAEACLRSVEAKLCRASRHLKALQDESLVCRRALHSSLHALRVGSLESQQEVERHATALYLLGQRLGVEPWVLDMLPMAASTRPPDRNICHTLVFKRLGDELSHVVSSLESMLPQVSAEVERFNEALACARWGADMARGRQRTNYEAFQAAHAERQRREWLSSPRAIMGAGVQRGNRGAKRALVDGVSPADAELLAGSGDFHSIEVVGDTTAAPPVIQEGAQCRERDGGRLSEHGAPTGQFSCFWEHRAEDGGDGGDAQGAALAEDADGADEEWTDALASALKRDSGTTPSQEVDEKAGTGERILLALLNHGGDEEMAEIKGLTAADIAKVRARREQQGPLKGLGELPRVLGRRVTTRKLLRDNALPLQ